MEPDCQMEVVVDLATCCYCSPPEGASETAVQGVRYTILAEIVDHRMYLPVDSFHELADHHYRNFFAAWLKLESPFSPRLKQNPLVTTTAAISLSNCDCDWIVSINGDNQLVVEIVVALLLSFALVSKQEACYDTVMEVIGTRKERTSEKV
jgi:hypothetical protein